MTVPEYMEHLSVLEYHAQDAIERAMDDLEQRRKGRSKSRKKLRQRATTLARKLCKRADHLRGMICGGERVVELRDEVTEIAACALLLLAEIDRHV